MTWIYLSPHFDDAAYSCGGLIWSQSREGEAPEVWTVFSGRPGYQPLTPFAQSLHARWQLPWQAAVEAREREDQEALRCLEVPGRGLGIPECVYRYLPDGMPVVQQEADLWQAIPPGEIRLAETLAETLSSQAPPGANLVSPLSLGNHVDHRIVRAAAEKCLEQGRGVSLWFYADYPYAMRGYPPQAEEEMEEVTFPISEPALAAWQQAAAAYASQFSSFWQTDEQMRAELKEFRDKMGGITLYRHP